MADLFLNWRDIAPSTLDDASTTSIETGGVAVDVTFASEDAFSTAFTFAADGYVEDADGLNPNSWLKLFDDANDDADAPTGNLTLDFRATDTDLYTDQVQNVSFRINDIDTLGLGGDLSEANVEGFEDIVTVLAFDAAGNAVPVSLTPEAGGPSVSGATATGTSETVFTDAAGSILVNIDGPISRIEIQYANGDNAQQAVTVSDVNFTTVDNPGDNPPVAVDDSAETPEDTAVIIDVLTNDSDPDGDPISVTGATVDTGTVVVNPDGTLTYVPPADYNGPATITYTIEDDSGNEATGQVAVTVTPVNDDPVANPDAAETPEDTPIIIPDPSINDTDVDGDDLTVTEVGTPTNGTATLNPDGTVTYTPNDGFTGEDTIPYTVDDGNGGTDQGEIIVTVTPVDEIPDAVDDSIDTSEGDPVVIPVLGNDSDPEGEPLTITDVSDPLNGSVTENPDGTVTYTPAPGFTGTDQFTYTIEDPAGNADTATVTVNVNSDPDAVDDADETPFETPIVVSVLTNDTDPESDPLSITGFTQPTNGTVTDPGDGTLVYLPDDGFSGEDTFEYSITDGNGGEDTATVTITVQPEADQDPVAVDDSIDTSEGDPVVIPVLGNDSDPENDPLTITGVSDPLNGSVTENPDGTLTYTPNPGFTGTDQFTYTIEDPAGNADTATVTVNVNSDPDAVDDADETPFETPIIVSVLTNDTDPESDPLSITGFTQPTNGTVTDPGDGTLVYLPDDGFSGEDTFEYSITDGNGGEDTATVTITVQPENSVNAEDDTDTTAPVTPVTIEVLANDSDPNGDTFSLVSVGTPLNGTAVAELDGTVTYTPNAGFTGQDQFPYTIRDSEGNEDTATVTVTVNSAPDAVDDSDTTAPGLGVIVEVLDNDTDPEGDTLTVTDATDPDNGEVVVNPDGTVTYTPDAGFEGQDTFNYTIEDPLGEEDTATVTITVGDNSAPDAVDDSSSTAPVTPVILDVLGNDTDPENDPLSVTGFTDPDNGTVVQNPDGTLTYTPDAGHTGEDTFNYTITDGNGGSDTATVTVTTGNQPPVAVDDTGTTSMLDPITVSPLDNDTDPEGDPLTVTSIGEPTNGTATLNPDGTVTYTPGFVTVNGIPVPFTGDDTIPYTIEDGQGGTDTGEIVITVDGRIDADIFPVSDFLQPVDPFNGVDEDPDVENDRDSVDGTGGADTIATGDDRDTINSGGGDDLIRPGIDDDLVTLGAGNDTVVDVQGADTILGGEGDDSIIAGIDTFSDYPGDDPTFPLLNFDSDPNPEDGRDSVQGNNGNDVIFTGDDDDTIDGGQDNDTIDAGIDDDSVMGGQGDDSIIGGHGSDTLDGGQGDDFIDGSNLAALEIPDATDPNADNDKDSILGALGNDTLLGGDDDDTLVGGSGNDSLDGGIDDDLLLGGGDSDTLIGGDGADTLDGGDDPDSIDGGDGRDQIVIGSAVEGTNDTINGGSGVLDPTDPTEGNPNNGDWDVLDLTAVGRPDGTNPAWRLVDERPDSNGNGQDGTIEFLDAAGNVTGSFDFFEIEEIVPCFTPGTLIATPQGERLVEDLKVGDRIITRDNGIQEIRWMGQKDVSGTELARKPHLKPVLIRKGALGKGLPEHDTLVSPNHRVLVANDKTALYFEEREVLVAAKHLTGLDGVDEVESLGVTYIHFMFDQHEVVLSNGAWTESFQPGDYTLKGIGNAQRQEIFDLFPELEHAEGLRAYGAARRSLKKHEAQLVTSS